MKIYISGKITGVENYAELFQVAETRLLARGHQVVNPVKIEHNHDLSWESYMREDIRQMLDCEAIYMLIGYTKSRGAKIEYSLAKTLNFKILYECFESKPKINQSL